MSRTAMSETRLKPILFNTEMINAILDGRKTVMRRIMKDAPDIHGLQPYTIPICKEPQGLIALNGRVHHFKSPYQVGDTLYVRETWGISNFDVDEQAVYIVYEAGNEKENCRKIVLPKDKFEHLYNKYSESCPDWYPSIHMPKEAARIFLRVTDVRVERLQDITEDDVINEGAEKLILCPTEHGVIESDGTLGDMCWNTGCCGENCKYIDKSYGELFGEIVWDNTIKKSDFAKYGWAANPWVWVIEFNMINNEGKLKQQKG